jgi:hypothetical protein
VVLRKEYILRKVKVCGPIKNEDVMKIAVLGWGSLVWDQRELPTKGSWEEDGPLLPLEFSRVSKDGRLTLVIDLVNGKPTKTCYALSSRTDLVDAVADLRDREGTVANRIGYLNIIDRTDSLVIYQDQDQVDVFEKIKEWAVSSNFDAVVWTALPSQFKYETGKNYSVECAIEYINSLPKSAKKIAIEYIEKAPSCVETPFRRRAAEVKLIRAIGS